MRLGRENLWLEILGHTYGDCMGGTMVEVGGARGFVQLPSYYNIIWALLQSPS